VKLRDRSPIYIALADLFAVVLNVVIVAVAPAHKANGIEHRVEAIITLDWPVSWDADLDLWVRTPSGKPVSYNNREVGCAVLDRDSRGFLDSVITLPDGSTVKVLSYKETVSIRCLEPGRYDVAAHAYDVRIDGRRASLRNDLGIKARTEVVKINPTIQTVFAKDVTLNSIWQCENVVSFDLSRTGEITFVDPPLTCITEGEYRPTSTTPSPSPGVLP